MAYAEGTTVDSFKSRVEIERMLQKVGCTHVGVMHEPGFATVSFRKGLAVVQIRIGLPDAKDAPRRRHDRQTWAEQAGRERWRQLLLVLKAKFTALEQGIETFEETFLPHLVLGGTPLRDKLLPAVRQAISSEGPLMLGAGS
jgi:hypothetical protein